jgi:hypothetical protein
MVCFCDMPLSQAAAHMSIYGRYAIGLTKDWGMAAGVSPVLYTYSGSATTEATLFLHLQIEDLQDTLDDDASFHPRTERLLCFLKPYSAELLRHGKQPTTVRFYDEREWRYVPADGWRGLNHEQFSNQRYRDSANEALWPQCCLSFEPSDIRYIIVEREQEIPRVIKEIQRIKSRKYDLSDIEVLCSRVVAAHQILADF